MSIYAIGDVQGCYASLQALLKKIRYNPDRDFLWFCGDIINRGPDSLKTLTFVDAKVSAGEALMVLGNHDLYFLALALGIVVSQEKNSLGELLASPKKNKFIDFLRQQPLCHYDAKSDYFFVHAGLVPEWDKKDALKYSKEVQQALLTDSIFFSFLETMYGNEPSKWRQDLSGYERLRFITNVLTRIRFCSDDGVLDLTNDGVLASAKNNTHPWFQVPNRKSKNDKIIFGHWAALYPDWNKVLSSHLFPVDSGCVWGNALSAFELEAQSYFSVPSQENGFK